MFRISSWTSRCVKANRFFQSSATLMLVGALALSSAHGQTSGARGDFVDRVDRAEGRPAGGGGGGDIVVFDIVVFDIIDSATKADGSPAAPKGGRGNLVLMVGLQFLESDRVLFLGESEEPGVYEVLVDLGDSIEFGLVWLPNEKPLQVGVMIVL